MYMYVDVVPIEVQCTSRRRYMENFRILVTEPQNQREMDCPLVHA